MTPDELKPEDQMMRYIAAKWISKPIYVVAELGIADLLAAVLEAHPGMTGTLADLPPVITGARKRLEDLGLSTRCRAVPCNFFERVPPVGETCLLSNVVATAGGTRPVAGFWQTSTPP
jgi:hypothetical protein